MSSGRSIRILIQIDWVDVAETVSRLWDGSGPYIDADLNVWVGAAALSGITGVDMAINGEAVVLNIELSGVNSTNSDLAWLSFTNNEIIGSIFRILIQTCDDYDQPVGDPEVKFTGTIDNIIFHDKAAGDDSTSILIVEVVNRFTLRRIINGSVLSDTDQKARAAILNPAGNPDRFAERVPLMLDKTVSWPQWN